MSLRHSVNSIQCYLSLNSIFTQITKNILNVGYSSEQRLRWISYIDEYSPTLHYVEGPRNVIADTFSRLLRQDDPSVIVGKKAITEDSELAYYSFADDREIFDCLINLPYLSSDKKQKQQKSRKRCKSNRRDSHQRHLNRIETNANGHCPYDINAIHCYLNLPTDLEEDNPLDIENIKEKQDEDNDPQQTAIKHPEWYSHKTFDQVTDVLCYTKPGDNLSNWKIALPKESIIPTVKRYHQVTGHPGSKRLYEQIRQRYHDHDLRRYIDNFNCDYCQRNKLDGKGYGLLPEPEVQSIPFKVCAVGLIRPWVVQVRGNPYEFDALTVINTVTNFVELIRVDKKISDVVTRKYAQCWLSRYP